MKIKRYTAASMRAALDLVRAEQGPDAVILSSRRGEDGIEVIAAVDYDEALFADAKRQSAALAIAPPSNDTSPASVKMAPAAPAAAVTPAASTAPAKPTVLRPAATAAPAAPAPARAAPVPAAARATPATNSRICAACSRPDLRA
jgi:flagellar biosynthesis protein FlhF